MTRARRCCVGLCLKGGRYQTRTDDLFGVNEARYQLRQSPPALSVRVDSSGCPAVLRTRRAARVWRAARVQRRTVRRWGALAPCGVGARSHRAASTPRCELDRMVRGWKQARSTQPRTTRQRLRRAEAAGTGRIRMNSGDTPGEREGFWWKRPGSYRVYVVAATAERQVRMWRSGSASPCQGEGREFESRHPLECGASRSPATHQRVSHRSGTHGDVNLDGGVAERLGSGLQSRPRGFESRPHLQQHPPDPVRTPVQTGNLGDWRSGSALP